ncbi:uncharacterized protein LOC132718756, partial [Ruditapes philippinarum]|uniref:uncharacterized protein LOC132718756 n=1 Tax=Ruditapes philippinarum TaxID=129788 RepID=UPI00295AEC04
MGVLDDMSSTDGVVNSGYQSENSERDKDDDGHFIMTKCSTNNVQSHGAVKLEMESSQEQELQHASNLTLSHSVSASSFSNKSTASTLKVEIADIDGEESINLTTTTLRKCKRQVLRPYWRLLMF